MSAPRGSTIGAALLVSVLAGWAVATIPLLQLSDKSLPARAFEMGAGIGVLLSLACGGVAWYLAPDGTV